MREILRFRQEQPKEEEPPKEFTFLSGRMIEEITINAIKKGNEIDTVNRIKRGLKSKDLIW